MDYSCLQYEVGRSNAVMLYIAGGITIVTDSVVLWGF